ncbi:hypothetical protein AB0K60_01775 [Thermopolyspora sp. NPDC052614]|uniref:hypothetical protein n=1 Tax=Thermopolyspora sp. NPDC052614 TaxID=3155682 RepID=UPI003443A512
MADSAAAQVGPPDPPGGSGGLGRHDRDAICLGGPCHGLLVHVEQDVGVLGVPVPRRSPDEPVRHAGYRITGERVRYFGRAEPYIALHWVGPAESACECSAP